MSEHHEEYLDLCAAYALGVIDEVGQRRLEEHLAHGCSICEAALADFSSAAVAIASTAAPAKPSPRLRERVLAAARSQPRAPSLRRRPAFVQVVLAAASIALLATTVTMWQRVERMTAERDATRVQLEEIARELEDSKRIERLLASPDTDCFDLAATGTVDTTLSARACFDRSSGGAVLVFHGATPPSGHDYELWVLHGDHPVSLGIVRADASGRALTHLDAIASPVTVTAFAVSLEPAGGSTAPGPSGPVIRVAALEG
ncbi:MAG: anti-sigma factor [Candidatus Latescibacteria bacterium]|nr:anti-sigma factor [Candidatus Latescibacterota bacterium]